MELTNNTTSASFNHYCHPFLVCHILVYTYSHNNNNMYVCSYVIIIKITLYASNMVAVVGSAWLHSSVRFEWYNLNSIRKRITSLLNRMTYLYKLNNHSSDHDSILFEAFA